MKCLAFITLNLMFITNTFAMGNWAARPQSSTEAGTCVECARRAAFQGQQVEAVNVDLVRSDGKGTLITAMKEFELFVKNNPQCISQTRYGLISNLSSGTGLNVSQVVVIGKDGKVNFASLNDKNGKAVPSSFWAGEGVGVSNECGSNASPHGFMRIGDADYRSDIDRTNPKTGETLRSEWPTCGNLNPNFKYNRLRLSGLEPGYNDNLSETDARKCSNGEPRYARLHSIKYSGGSTTQGCKGLQLADWCQWAPKLAGGCAYNYDGHPSPAIKKLMKTKSI